MKTFILLFGIILALGVVAGMQAVEIYELKGQLIRKPIPTDGWYVSDYTPDSVDSARFYGGTVSLRTNERHLLLDRPMVIDMNRGDSITDRSIFLTDDFKGDAAFYIIVPDGHESVTIPIHRNTFMGAPLDSGFWPMNVDMWRIYKKW